MQSLKVLKTIEGIDAVCVQFNSRNNLLAIGCNNGDVIIYEISKNHSISERSKLSLSYRGFTSEGKFNMALTEKYQVFSSLFIR